MPSYQCMNSNDKDKTAVKPFYLHKGDSNSSKMVFVLKQSPGALCNIGYPSEIHLKLKSHEISLAHYSCFSWPITLIGQLSVWNFAQSTAVSLPCSVQNFKPIGQLKRVLWRNEISRDLSLRWVWDGYPILRSTPGFQYSDVGSCCTIPMGPYILLPSIWWNQQATPPWLVQLTWPWPFFYIILCSIHQPHICY